jgi:hypothetical protein
MMMLASVHLPLSATEPTTPSGAAGPYKPAPRGDADISPRRDHEAVGAKERGLGLVYYALFLYHLHQSTVYRRAAARLLGGEHALAQAAVMVLEELERLDRGLASTAGELLSKALRSEEPEQAARSAAELVKLLRSAFGV